MHIYTLNSESEHSWVIYQNICLCILCVLILSSVPKHSESVVLFQGTQKDWGPTSHPDISTCLYLMSLILMLYNLQTCRLKIHFYDLFRVINDCRLSPKKASKWPNNNKNKKVRNHCFRLWMNEWMISVVSSEVLNCLKQSETARSCFSSFNRRCGNVSSHCELGFFLNTESKHLILTEDKLIWKSELKKMNSFCSSLLLFWTPRDQSEDSSRLLTRVETANDLKMWDCPFRKI